MTHQFVTRGHSQVRNPTGRYKSPMAVKERQVGATCRLNAGRDWHGNAFPSRSASFCHPPAGTEVRKVANMKSRHQQTEGAGQNRSEAGGEGGADLVPAACCFWRFFCLSQKGASGWACRPYRRGAWFSYHLRRIEGLAAQTTGFQSPPPT